MKTKLILVFAAGITAFGLYGLAGSLTNDNANTQPAPVVTKVVKPERTFKVWQLKRDVNSGEQLRRTDLHITLLPEKEAHAYGISQDMNFEFVKHSVFTESISAGTPLYREMYVTPDDDGYVDEIIAPRRVPFAINVDAQSVVGGVIRNGTDIDILALTRPSDIASMRVSSSSTLGQESISIRPVLMGIKVLQIKKSNHDGDIPASKVDLILELTQKQVSTLTIATKIAKLEVHKSLKGSKIEDLTANAGDVLTNFKSVTEFRASDSQIR